MASAYAFVRCHGACNALLALTRFQPNICAPLDSLKASQTCPLYDVISCVAVSVLCIFTALWLVDMEPE